MKLKFWIVLFLIAFVGLMHPTALSAQSKQIRKTEIKAEKKKAQQKKALDLSIKKDVKRRFEMQSPTTRTRMKKNRKDAKKINDQGHESFFKRIFHRKRK